MFRHRYLIIGLAICLISVCLIAVCITLQNQVSPVSDSSSPGIPSIPNSDALTPEPDKIQTPNEITGTGVILYLDIEGGFFGVQSDDGRHFLPSSISEDLRVNGTPVSFIFKPAPDTVSMNMWGEPVSIILLQKQEGIK